MKNPTSSTAFQEGDSLPSYSSSCSCSCSIDAGSRAIPIPATGINLASLVEAARAELQRELIAAVREARRRDGSSDWRGAAWLLERLFPETFARRSKATSATQPEAPAPDPAEAVPRTPGAIPAVLRNRDGAPDKGLAPRRVDSASSRRVRPRLTQSAVEVTPAGAPVVH